jgi:hypothetical protein
MAEKKEFSADIKAQYDRILDTIHAIPVRKVLSSKATRLPGKKNRIETALP